MWGGWGPFIEQARREAEAEAEKAKPGGPFCARCRWVTGQLTPAVHAEWVGGADDIPKRLLRMCGACAYDGRAVKWYERRGWRKMAEEAGS